MAEHSILFSGAMIKAIRQLYHPKTQTRRVVKPQPVEAAPAYLEREYRKGLHEGAPIKDAGWWFSCPYGQPGDRLWVRETWAPKVDDTNPATPATWYAADFNAPGAANTRAFVGGAWRPSIHMPRNRSRITLEIAGVRVERLQDISEADVCAELGAAREWPGPGPEPYKRDLIGAFRERWQMINGKRPGCGWTDNPWVWVLEFRRVEL